MAAWRVCRARLRPRSSTSILNHYKPICSSKLMRSVTLTKTLTEEKAVLSQQLGKWMRQYEDFVGLTEVREAQNRVVQAQNKFTEAQELRRNRQQQLLQIQQQLKEVHLELDRTSRGEDRYLHLVTQEHAIIRQEKQLIEEFNLLEKSEREYFSVMSIAVRESHEKERAHAERTKYWSIIGSICGAVIGIVGTSVNNWLRMRELRGLVHESSNPTRLQNLINDLSETTKYQHNQLTLFISDLKAMLGNDDTHHLKANLFEKGATVTGDSLPTEKLEAQTNEILALVRKQDASLSSEIKDVKALIASNRLETGENTSTTVYIGRDVEQLMKDTEQNLEWKMKINALATVAAIYGALALTLPLIFKAFGGP